jgi:hypothetical protein
MTNPYDSSALVQTAPPEQSSVRRWAFLALTLATFAALVSLPALFILNQERDFYPLTFGITDLESDGESISLHSTMIFLFCISLAMLLSAAVFGITAWYNARRNGRSPL